MLRAPEHEYTDCLTIPLDQETTLNFDLGSVYALGCTDAYTVSHALIESSGKDLSFMDLNTFTGMIDINPTSAQAGETYYFWIQATAVVNG